MTIVIANAPEVYQPYLSVANSKGNKNTEVDTYDEAALAAEGICSAQPEECEGFIDYLGENNFYLGLIDAGNAPWMLKVVKLNVNGIIQKILRTNKPDFKGTDQEAWEYFLTHQQEFPEISAALKSKGFVNFLEDPGGEIGAWARKVTEGETTDAGKLKAYIAAFKQKVKYDASPLRRKGRILTAYEVFKNGYGDCNEMSSLFWVGAQAVSFKEEIKVGFLMKLNAFTNLIFEDGVVYQSGDHILNSIGWGKDFTLDLTDTDPRLVDFDPEKGKPLSLQENLYLSYIDSFQYAEDPSEKERMLGLLNEILPDPPEQIKFEMAYRGIIAQTSRYVREEKAETDLPDLLLLEIQNFLAQRPRDFVLFYLQGLIYEKKGKKEQNKELLSRAKDAFEAAVRENPYLIMAYFHLTNIYSELGAVEQAGGALYRLAQKYPKDARVNILLAERLGSGPRGEEYLKRAVELWDQPQTHFDLSLLYLNQNEVGKAKEEIEKAKAGVKNLLRTSILIEIALSRQELNFAEMEKKLKAYQEIFPEDYEHLSLEYGATKDLAEGKIDGAVEKFYKRLGLAPEKGEVYRGLGWCLLIQGKYDEAETVLQKGSKLQDDDAHSFYKYFLFLYLLTKKYENIGGINQKYAEDLNISRFGADIQKAEEMGQEALSEYYDKTQISFVLGCIALQKGETEKAKNIFEASIKDFPQDNPSLVPLALIYISKGELKKAQKLLETYKTKNYLAFAIQAELLMAQKKYQPAEKILKEALDSGVKDYYIYLLLWTTYLLQGKTEEAKEAFRRLMQESL